MNIGMTDEETGALIRELNEIVWGDPLSPRIVTLKEILGQLRPEPEPLPPRRHYEPPSKGRYRRRGWLLQPIQRNSSVTIPLILQIQQAALDSNSSVTDTLRKAKVACTKLGLREFGNWVDLELNGYTDIPWKDLPKYRELHGTPEAYNPYHGWQPIIFPTGKGEWLWSTARIGMSISAIEDLLRRREGDFVYPYPPEAAAVIRKAINFNISIDVKLDASHIGQILNIVRNIILE